MCKLSTRKNKGCSHTSLPAADVICRTHRLLLQELILASLQLLLFLLQCLQITREQTQIEVWRPHDPHPSSRGTRKNEYGRGLIHYGLWTHKLTRWETWDESIAMDEAYSWTELDIIGFEGARHTTAVPARRHTKAGFFFLLTWKQATRIEILTGMYASRFRYAAVG